MRVVRGFFVLVGVIATISWVLYALRNPEEALRTVMWWVIALLLILMVIGGMTAKGGGTRMGWYFGSEPR